jgi:hypothetical protein
VASLFFDKLYASYDFDGSRIRESSLFNNIYDTNYNKISYNPYLQNESNYNTAKSNIDVNKIKYLNCSIDQLCKDNNLRSAYDLILLSNIADYSHEMYQTADYLRIFKNNITDELKEYLSEK